MEEIITEEDNEGTHISLDVEGSRFEAMKYTPTVFQFYQHAGQLQVRQKPA